jgi:hypothetical protein
MDCNLSNLSEWIVGKVFFQRHVERSGAYRCDDDVGNDSYQGDDDDDDDDYYSDDDGDEHHLYLTAQSLET